MGAGDDRERIRPILDHERISRRCRMSVGYEAEGDVIRAKLVAAWGATSPVSWDGLMNGAEYRRDEGVSFIRPRIEDGEEQTVAVGGPSRRHRRFSSLIIEIFRPAGSGSETALQWCDSLISAFYGYASGGVNFWLRGSKFDSGQDGKFAKWTVLLPYYVEETN
jgi:hypothetical protein